MRCGACGDTRPGPAHRDDPSTAARGRQPVLSGHLPAGAGRPTATAGLGVDEATLPLIVVGGAETEDTVEQIKNTAKQAIDAAFTLGGKVQAAWCTEERNWRNQTGAGGIQLLLVELVVMVQM